MALADRLGYDYAWEVEHHFLDEYSHSSAPEVFLAAAAARTQRIRLGHGIRQVIPNYNHPARTAEGLATLDIISNGRVDFGIGEGATRLELGGFAIKAKEKRAMALEAAEQSPTCWRWSPIPVRGRLFLDAMPQRTAQAGAEAARRCGCRTQPRPIKVAASIGGARSPFPPHPERRGTGGVYYGIIRSEQCVPIGRTVNASIAMVSSFSIHRERAEAIRRGHEGFEFFSYAMNALVARDTVPGRTDMWGDYLKKRGNRTEEIIANTAMGPQSSGIGTPEDMRAHLTGFQAAGVDQVIFLQQAGRNRHEHICESLELFAADVMPGFKAMSRRARRRSARSSRPGSKRRSRAQEMDAAARDG